MRQSLILLFAVAGGLTLSGIAANLYRILARKPASRPETMLYYAVMLAAYWSFALGAVMLSFFTRL